MEDTFTKWTPHYDRSPVHFVSTFPRIDPTQTNIQSDIVQTFSGQLEASTSKAETSLQSFTNFDQVQNPPYINSGFNNC